MDNDDLLQMIEQSAQKEATLLDLSGRNVGELPPEIGQLTNLTWLDLTPTQLTSLPPEIGQLTNLTVLHLTRRRLKSASSPTRA